MILLHLPILKKLYLVFPFIFLVVSFSYAQNTSKDKIHETYDNIVGLDNTGLYNGTEFTDLFLNTDGTFRYLKGFDYSKGSVFYKGEYYVNIFLKYDLLEDNLLTRSDDNLSVFNVKLIPEFVEWFTIYNRKFVRLTNTNLGLSGNGFFEEVYSGNQLILYIKHSKRKKDKALKSGIQYRFFDTNLYVLKRNNSYFKVNSVKDLRKAIPEKEDEIRQFHRSNRILYKSDPDSFMTRLIAYLDEPINMN